MAAPSQNSPQALCAAILAEARRESEEILRRAQQEAEALRAKAKAEADTARQERLNLARAEAARRKDLILATVPVEANRMRAARIEALLQSIFAEIRRRLLERDGFDYRDTLIALAVEAISRMAGEAFVVKLSPADHAALGEGLAGEIAQGLRPSQPLSITLADEPAITEGGLILQDAGGFQIWDNRLPVRLERLWPELRRQIAVHTSLLSENRPAGGGA